MPWSASTEQVLEFLDGVQIQGGSEGVHFTIVNNGWPSGEAYVELVSEEDLEAALARHKNHMGKRFVEVFKSSKSEMDWAVKTHGPSQLKVRDTIIRVRGLPYGCTPDMIQAFFQGLDIMENGITILLNEEGRTRGDGYVQFTTAQGAEEALTRHREKMGRRYIEVFKSSLQELRGADPQSLGRVQPDPNHNGIPPSLGGPDPERRHHDGRFMGGPRAPPRGRGVTITGHSVHMQGLPYDAHEDDVAEFFKPLVVLNVRIHYHRDGNATGKADVDFRCHAEAQDAMTRHKQLMGHRYIQLFLRSTERPQDGQHFTSDVAARGRRHSFQQQQSYTGAEEEGQWDESGYSRGRRAYPAPQHARQFPQTRTQFQYPEETAGPPPPPAAAPPGGYPFPPPHYMQPPPFYPPPPYSAKPQQVFAPLQYYPPPLEQWDGTTHYAPPPPPPVMPFAPPFMEMPAASFLAPTSQGATTFFPPQLKQESPEALAFPPFQEGFAPEPFQPEYLPPPP